MKFDFRRFDIRRLFFGTNCNENRGITVYVYEDIYTYEYSSVVYMISVLVVCYVKNFLFSFYTSFSCVVGCLPGFRYQRSVMSIQKD